jgi:hypothetical protein
MAARSDTARERPQGTAGSSPRKRFRFEVSFPQLLLIVTLALGVMVWMFVFGVLVGRDVPVVEVVSDSWQAQFLRFLGLPVKSVKTAAKATPRGEDPQKMLEELDYHKALTQKPGDGGARHKDEGGTRGRPPQPAQGESAATPKQKAPARDAQPPEKRESAQAAPASKNEQFALLVTSVSNLEHAQKMMQQLRAKGYQPQLETLDKPDEGRWYRILVGSFRERSEALRYAADFNKKEKLQGMVIRVSP